MSWPALDQNERWVDWSYYQNDGTLLHRPFDVAAFLQVHPEVEGAIIRFCWPGGSPDKHYAHYYDGFREAGKKVAGYGWPDPRRSVVAVLEDWKRAMGDRVPPLIAADWEEAEPFVGRTKAQVTAHLAELEDQRPIAFPNSVHINYARGGWLDAWITPGEWFHNIRWWLAHWIYPPPDYTNQAVHWREIEAVLPIDNAWTPNRGSIVKIRPENVIAWQISSKGAIVPKGTSDMDFFLKSFIGPIYGGVGPPPPPPNPKVPVELRVPAGKVEVRVVEI